MVKEIGRQLVGAAAAWVVFVGQSVVVYIGLLGYAVVADADTGGPLAGPLLVLLAGALGVALLPLLFVPAAVAGQAAAKTGRLLVKLVVALACAAGLAAIYVAAVAAVTDVTIANTVVARLGGAVAALGPVAVHVLVAHGVPKIGSILRRVRPPAHTSAAA